MTASRGAVIVRSMERKTLLLVDDVDLFLELEKSFLSRQSFALHTASSGREALEKVGALRPHLILLDLFMPDLNGDAVCRQVKSSPATRDTPVIIISTDTPEVRQMCFAAGADEFLPKPLQRETLLRAIEEMLRVAQRKHPRISARLDCVLGMNGSERRTMIHCLSAGGAFVESPDPLPPGGRLRLSFRLPRPPLEVTVEAVVRWNGLLKGSASVRGAGMEFVHLPDPAREALESFIEAKRSVLSGLHSFSQ